MKKTLENAKLLMGIMNPEEKVRDVKIFEFKKYKMALVLILDYKPARIDMIDTGNGTMYGVINSCLIKDDKIQPLKSIGPNDFSKIEKGEIGFIASSIDAESTGKEVTIKAITSCDAWFGNKKEFRDVSTTIVISENWEDFKNVF